VVAGDRRKGTRDGIRVADVEGDKVRLSANADVAVTMEEEK